MKILVADDDPDQLEVRCMLLDQYGFEAIRAGDTATALEIAARRKPNCALADLRFPAERDGLALVRELKKLDPGMYVILLTGADAARLRSLDELSAADDVFVKGEPVDKLLQKLKAARKHKAAASGL